MHDFVAAKESIYKRSWVSSPWAVLSWGLRQVGLIGDTADDKIPAGKLVILQNLEGASKALSEQASQCSSRTDRIMSRRTFNETYGRILGSGRPLSTGDTDVLLRFLARDKGLIAFDGQTVKLKGPSETEVKITQEDSTIASLKTLMGDIEAQINTLTQRVDTLSASARDAVAKKNFVSAKASLRSKKMAETNLSRQSATLGQLEEVYSKIGQAADNVELVRIMEGSTGVLANLNAEVGSIERVDNIVDDLKEQMTQVDEINNVIGEVGQNAAIDEGEVDDELEAMEAAERQKVETAERAAREAEEQKEAEETKRRLDALEAIEKEAEMEKSKKQDQFTDGKESERHGVTGSTQGIKRISLEQQSAQ